ncbi:MAG: hypothetical protein AAGD11_07625 [Planctomycetota bacterium]
MSTSNTPNMKQDWEAVAFSSYEKNGEKKYIRHFIANLVADNDNGEGMTLFIPEHMALKGKIRLQPKQERNDGPANER